MHNKSLLPNNFDRRFGAFNSTHSHLLIYNLMLNKAVINKASLRYPSYILVINLRYKSSSYFFYRKTATHARKYKQDVIKSLRRWGEKAKWTQFVLLLFTSISQRSTFLKQKETNIICYALENCRQNYRHRMEHWPHRIQKRKKNVILATGTPSLLFNAKQWYENVENTMLWWYVDRLPRIPTS